MRIHRREERGAVSIQVALVAVPALFVIIILSLQLTFAWMAAVAVQTAAENAVDAASARTGSETDAREAADRVLTEAGFATVTALEVARTDRTVRVDIEARAFQFLPVPWLVRGSAQAEVEDFRSSTERR